MTDSPPGWKFSPAAEFPWKFEQLVGAEENWRGTWVLEVKDMHAMDWGIVRVPDESGQGVCYKRQPTRQLPFPPDGSPYLEELGGGQDDVMVGLGKAMKRA